jgi:NADPH:quinone reductase-like Zn-dependent oxidoreductase
VKAIVQTGYGRSDVLRFRDLAQPMVGDDEVLVRVHASSIHAGDVFAMHGSPFAVRLVSGLRQPRKDFVPGSDVAGRVEAIGAAVTRFRPGEDVFGASVGACAEYARAREGRLVPKPPEVSFERAAAVPTSALAALQGLRDAGGVQPGQRVLVNGASGGVGTFAVQIAKSFGAEVTGVCSTGNVDLVRSIGADHVIDYTQEDFTRGDRRYDLILDNVGNHPLAECRRVLAPRGTLVPNTGHAGMAYVIRAFATSLFIRGQARPFVSTPKHEDLLTLRGLLETGSLSPVIDRTYRLSEAAEAFAHVDGGHARGKVVIVCDAEPA